MLLLILFPIRVGKYYRMFCSVPVEMCYRSSYSCLKSISLRAGMCCTSLHNKMSSLILFFFLPWRWATTLVTLHLVINALGVPQTVCSLAMSVYMSCLWLSTTWKAQDTVVLRDDSTSTGNHDFSQYLIQLKVPPLLLECCHDWSHTHLSEVRDVQQEGNNVYNMSDIVILGDLAHSVVLPI